MNGWDILLILLITASVVLALRHIHLDRKKGKGCLGCSGNCAGCQNHTPKEKERQRVEGR